MRIANSQSSLWLSRRAEAAAGTAAGAAASAVAVPEAAAVPAAAEAVSAQAAYRPGPGPPTASCRQPTNQPNQPATSTTNRRQPKPHKQ